MRSVDPLHAADSVDRAVDGCPGIQIEISDPRLQAYLQRYPFASGPDLEMNRRGVEVVSAGIRLRPAGRRVVPTLLKPDEARLSTEETVRAVALMDVIGMSEEKKLVHLNDFGWEANLVPRDTKSVLVIGCGNGVELIFLRAVLPQARITAMDYYKKLLPGLEAAVGVTFFDGDVGKLLPQLGREFDLVFSNHTMEHLYDPNKILRTLANLLITGGHILSILPMMGFEGTPYLKRVWRHLARLAKDPSAKIHPLELVYFDPGHPWKTNPDDIAATLTDSGFSDVRIYQRDSHRSRPLQLPPGQYVSRRRRETWLNRLLLGTPRRLLIWLFPRKVPAALPRLYHALERRLPLATNMMINRYTEEALFLARVDR